MEHHKLQIRWRRITDLLHQTVQAVVAAVTVAQKVPEVNNSSTAIGAAPHAQVMLVTEPTEVLQ
jgi:hypothetical protein